jgi:hypothetical protein
MKNILNNTDYAEIQNRIKAISAASTRRWGKMNIEQMLVHCAMQLKLALGEVPYRTQGPSFMRSGLGKWILFSTLPWPKGANTADEMNPALGNFTYTDIETEKKDLLNYLERARQETDLKPHPLFGKLNRQEWARLIYKHLDHHLSQFSSR